MNNLIDINLKTIYDLKDIYNNKGKILQPYNYNIMRANRAILDRDSIVLYQYNLKTQEDLLEFALDEELNHDLKNNLDMLNHREKMHLEAIERFLEYKFDADILPCTDKFVNSPS